jgi:hypothetical protein
MMHPQRPVFIHRILRPNPGEILYTHALSFASLANFIATGTCYSSDDDPEAVRRTYAAVGLEDLLSARFTCATASISESFRNSQVNVGYGEGDNLFLILDPVRIASRAYVFNGDVKNLGNTVGKTPNASTEIVVIQPSLVDLPSSLKALVANDRHPVKSPRRRGSFEARVIGGITYGDVMQVCTPTNCSDAEMQEVKHLLDLMTKTRAQ